MKDFHQMFKEDFELDGVAISFCGLIDVENAVIDAYGHFLSYKAFFGEM